MASLSIGDGVQHFLNSRHNTQLKQRLNILSEELATGRLHDIEKRLGGDRGRYASVERSLTLLDGFELSASEAASTLSLMQTTLDRVDDMRATLGSQLVAVSPSSSAGEKKEAAIAAQNAFAAIAESLNARLADRSLFAGTATDGAALAAPQDMLADLAAAAAGATDAAGVMAIVDDWFDNPTGGFATSGYLGDPNAPISRRIDTNHTVTVPAKADDPALRAVLKAAAYTALVDSLPGLPGDEAATLMRKSGEALMTAGQGVAELQSRLGGVEARIEEVRTGHTAQRTALTLLRNDMVAADPYDTASALQEVQIQLETHYTLTARLSQLSLTEYLR